jgi:hypothetical protein
MFLSWPESGSSMLKAYGIWSCYNDTAPVVTIPTVELQGLRLIQTLQDTKNMWQFAAASEVKHSLPWRKQSSGL